MTVKELIEELEKLPKDAEVYKYNTSPDRWYGDTEDYTNYVEYREEEQEVIIH